MKKKMLTLMFVFVLTFVFGLGFFYADAAGKVKKAPAINTEITVNGINISWNEVEGAQHYGVYKRKENGIIVRIATVYGTSYEDDEVVNNTDYTYYVKAFENEIIGKTSKGKTSRFVSAPKISSVKNKADYITVTWKKVSGAQKYYLYKRKEGVSWSLVKTFDASAKMTYNDKKVVRGRVYYYAVRCKNDSYTSSFRKYDGTTRLKKCDVKSVASSQASVVVKWSAVGSAEKYVIYRKTASEGYVKLKTVSSKVIKYTDTSVFHNKKYTYKVVGIKGKSEGAAGKTGSVMYFAPGKITSFTNLSSGIQLKWKKGANVTGVILYRKAPGQTKWKRLGKITAESYTDKNVVPGQKYTYTLIQYNSKYKSSYMKSGFSHTYKKPSAPANTVTTRPGTTAKKLVALTFDDGPYAPVTNKILDCLKKYNSKATFFVVGSRLSAYSSTAKRIVSEGHEIGNHSFNHTIFTNVTEKEIKSEVDKTNSLIKKYTGTTAKIVRAPGGAVSDEVKKAVKYPLVNWSVDTLDWESRDKDSIVKNIKDNVADGSIVLMHDLYTATGEAACEIIPWLRNNGYELVTVSELMRRKGIDFTAGKLYYRGSPGV